MSEKTPEYFAELERERRLEASMERDARAIRADNAHNSDFTTYVNRYRTDVSLHVIERIGAVPLASDESIMPKEIGEIS